MKINSKLEEKRVAVRSELEFVKKECNDHSDKLDKLYKKQLTLESEMDKLNTKILAKTGENLFGKIFKTMKKDEVTLVKPLSFSGDGGYPIQCVVVVISKTHDGKTRVIIDNSICNLSSIGVEVTEENMNRTIAKAMEKALNG